VSASAPTRNLVGRWPVVRLRSGWLGNVLLLAIFAYLMLPPLLVLLYSSVKLTTGGRLPVQVAGFSLENLAFLLRDPATGRVLVNTVLYVGGSVVIGVSLCTTLAYLLERTDVPGRQFLRSLVLSPMAIPPIVLAISWTFLANPQIGPLSQLVHALTGLTPDIYTLGGMIFVTALLTTPSMYLLISPQLANFDASFEESAATSGARWWGRTRRIVLPLLSPAILSAVMLIAVISLEAFDVPAILGFPTNTYVFSTLIQQQLQPTSGFPNYGRASAFGLLLVLVTVCLTQVYRRRVQRADGFVTITSRGFKPATIGLGRWRYFAAAFVCLYCLAGLVLPFCIIGLTSLLPYYSLTADAFSRISLGSYARVFQSPAVAAGVTHTVVIMLVTATATTCLAFLAGWASARGRFRGSSLLLDVSFMSLGVPGVIFGLTILLIYLELPIPIYGTMWIIVVATMTRFLAYGVRLMDASVRQLDFSLYEAAQVTGASTVTIQRKVVLPLLLPAALRTWLWVAIRSMAELPIALILSTRDNQTLAVVLFSLWSTGNDFADAAAIAVLMVVVSAVGIFLITRIGSPARTETLMAAPG
jgi:iron(III) transport system permease protein